MEITLGILVFIVSVLAVLQGWQMINARRKNSHNPSAYDKLDGVVDRLDVIISKLGKMEQRLGDIWDKVNK